MRAIDLVIPMVFPSDPEWEREYRERNFVDATKHVRWRSWGTEELLVKCCMTFMPWVRDIHILLARESQVQEWMKQLLKIENGKLKIHFHREFIPAEMLPTWNSATIEMFLHRIPGLADQFIYANDDMFPVAPLEAEDFFRDGLPCQHFVEKAWPSRMNTFHKACFSGQSFVAKEFGGRMDQWLWGGHSMAAILKSSCEHLWKRDAKAMAASCSPLRQPKNFYQYVYPWYQHYSGQYVDHTPEYAYISVKSSADRVGEVIRKGKGIVCINDNECAKDIVDYARVVKEELQAKLYQAEHGEQPAQESGDYRIWVSYHRDELVEKHHLKEDERHRLFATHHEVEGENINSLNPVLSEMVTMWYVWKNQVKSDLVGFEHYRRHLRVARPLPEAGECQVFRVADFGTMTIYDQYAKWHNRQDMDTVLELLDERYGKDNAYARHIRTGRKLIANCTFLMRWEDFERLCGWLFPLLEDYGRAMGMDGLGTLEEWTAKAERDFGRWNNTVYQRRVVSFLAERLISAWINEHMKWHTGTDVAIVHYNTPTLTEAAIRSLQKQAPGCRVTVWDNSDREPFTATDAAPFLRVIDNTKGQLIDWEAFLAQYPEREMGDVSKSNFGSAKHSKSVDMLFDLLPDGFLLMDSDVLVMTDVRPLVDRRMALVGGHQVKHGIGLLQPFLCWLNVPMLAEHGVRYFDGRHIWALTPGCRWDTGAWVLHEVMTKGLPWKIADIWHVIVHLGHGSWLGSKAQAWLERHKFLYR